MVIIGVVIYVIVALNEKKKDEPKKETKQSRWQQRLEEMQKKPKKMENEQARGIRTLPRRKAEWDGQPLWPDITKENFIGELELERVAILEGRTQKGKTGVVLVLVDKQGDYFMAEASAAIVDIIHRAIANAERKWLDEGIM